LGADRADSRWRSPSLAVGIGAVALTAIVAAIYRDVTRAYYFNDDFQWLQGARTFAVANVLHIERYNHFYRPVIEIYFFIGRRLFGCHAPSFHMSAVRRASPAPVAGAIVYVDRENADGIPELYWDPAAEVASCGPDVHVVVR
jgi:hypothetical protein